MAQFLQITGFLYDPGSVGNFGVGPQLSSVRVSRELEKKCFFWAAEFLLKKIVEGGSLLDSFISWITAQFRC